MKYIHYETTDEYALSYCDSFVELRFSWRDDGKQLLSDFLSDFSDTFCELTVALRKIEAGELPSYGAFMDWYGFHVTSAGMHIHPGGEANYAGIKFEGKYGMRALKEMMDLHRRKYAEIYGIDIDAIDEDYMPLIDGIIEDYPAKAEAEAMLRFPKNEKEKE